MGDVTLLTNSLQAALRGEVVDPKPLLSTATIEPGVRSGRRVVVSSAPSRAGYRRWLVRCDCGREKVIRGAEFIAHEMCISCTQSRIRGTLRERIEAAFIPEPNSGCWIWTAVADSKGYGVLGVEGKNQKAHRLVHEMFKGPIPDGLHLDHLCRNRLCVNPDHLEPVTRRENILRGYGSAAQNARKDCCKNGHPFDEQNTRLQPLASGGVARICRRCKREEMRARRLAKQRGVS